MRQRFFEQPEDVPSDWFTAFPFDDDESRSPGVYAFERENPTQWVAAEDSAPAAVERWRELFATTVRWLGGDPTIAILPLRIEVSIDGRPRYLRMPFGSHAAHVIASLWERVNLDLLVQQQALTEYWRQRAGRTWEVPVFDPFEEPQEPDELGRGDDDFEGMPPPLQRISELLRDGESGAVVRTLRVPGDEALIEELERLHEELEETEHSGWIGATRHEFEHLSARFPDLVESLLDRYARLLVRFARLPESRLADARKSLSLTVPTDRSEHVVRSTSRFTGTTRWLDDWDETDETIVAYIEQLAFDDAEWVHDERAIAGRTEWDDDRSIPPSSRT